MYSHKAHIKNIKKYPLTLTSEKILTSFAFNTPCKMRKTKPNDESNTIDTAPEWPKLLLL
ncbi:hypothetical protein CXF88_08770 [Shewanella sp. ALD9]|nr:hypothetical protein CXF88_08770 [Shewanella sp. ALD9]